MKFGFQLKALIVLAAAASSSVWAAGFPSQLLERPDEWYASAEGKATTARVLSWQTPTGSWPKAVDTSGKMNDNRQKSLEGTFDNKSTTDELRYLARAYRATHDDGCKQAYLRGLDLILRAQYATGGWPQLFPLGKKDYPHRITFNDDAMIRLMWFLREVSEDQQSAWVGAERLQAVQKAVERGVECLLRCQIVVKGVPTVWCAQHHEETLAPASARAYELPSLSGSESAGILRFLMSLPNPSPRVRAAVTAGVAWFDAAKIKGIRIEKVNGVREVIEDPNAPAIWARFYDIETGQPFFCDRDGVKKPRLSDIGKERRNGYAWYGNWGEHVAKEYAKWSKRS